MLEPEQIIAANVETLISEMSSDSANPIIAKRMGLGDKTLWNVRKARPNPQMKTLQSVCRFFRIEPWRLLAPDLGRAALQKAAPDVDIEELLTLTTPRSTQALEAIIEAANQGRLTDEDLALLQAIAARFTRSV